jgi:hypothetical protein
MRELLVLGPFDIILISLIVIVMVGCWSISQSLLELELNSQSLSGWFSPPMVMFKEHVIQVKWVSKTWSNLVHMWWNIAGLINNAWSNLSNVHIDQKTVVSVYLEKFILS